VCCECGPWFVEVAVEVIQEVVGLGRVEYDRSDTDRQSDIRHELHKESLMPGDWPEVRTKR